MFGDNQQRGLIQLTLDEILQNIDKLDKDEFETSLTMTILEIYNENIYDLLSPRKE